MPGIMQEMTAWNAAAYLKFGDERTRPCRDLVARVEVALPRRVIDLGCGPGNSTAVLRARWPKAEVIGLDNSAEMLEKARTDDQARNDGQAALWVQGDIARWTIEEGERFDVVFSNAALQWVPDHAALFPRLFGRVATGGALAVQLPAYSDQPGQRLIREIARSTKWQARFTKVPVDWRTESVGFYYDVLAPLAARLELWETEYVHVVEGTQAVVEWYRATGLRPFLQALGTEGDRAEFVAEYHAALEPHYRPQKDGRVLFPFRRLFVVAYAG
jgi:trans-aconitate 2-methyltransferase